MGDVKNEFDEMPFLGPVAVQADDDVLRIKLVPGGQGDIGTCLEVFRLFRSLHALEIDAVVFGIEVAEPEFVQKKISVLDEGGFWDRLVLTNPVASWALHEHDLPGPFSISVHRRGNILGLRVTREQR